jgi:hypothetical protein
MAGETPKSRWYAVSWAEIAVTAIIVAVLAALLIPKVQMAGDNPERDQKRWEQWKLDQESVKELSHVP